MLPFTDASSPHPRRLLAVLLVMGYMWLFPWSEQIHNPNEMVRIYMTRAIVDHGTYAIGRRDLMANGQVRDHGLVHDQWGYVNDRALACDDPHGHPPQCSGWLYPAKAPGLSQLAVVPMWLQQRVFAGLGVPLTKAWLVWWLRWSCVVLPTVLAWLWLAGHLRRRLADPWLGLAVVLAGAFGSLSLTYGQMFAGHQPGGLALLLCFAAVTRAHRDGHRGWVVLAGLGAALAVWIEFTMAPAAAILIGWLALRRRQWADLGWLALGGLGPVVGLGHFDTLAFGAPWRLPYSHLENPGFVRDMAPGFMGIHLPTAEKVGGSLWSPFTGLYFWAPWMVLAWLGPLGMRWRRHQGDSQPWWQSSRAEAAVAFAICLYFLFFQTTHALWRGGWVVGPRYITAMVPFAVLATAHGIDSLQGRAAALARWLLAVGGITAVIVTAAATAVSQGFPFEVYNPLPEVVGPLLRRGWVWSSPPLWLGAPAAWAALPWALALLAAAGWLASLATRRRIGAMISAMAAAAVVVLALWHVQREPPRTPAERAETVRFLMQTWWPPHPKGARPL